MASQRKVKPKPKQLPAPQAPQRKEVPQAGRLLGLADGPGGKHPKWRLSLLDVDHAGSWSWAVDEAALRQITAFLSQMERLTWTEIQSQMFNSKKGSHRKHHPMQLGLLCSEARERLRALRLDDVDELFRFRLGNMSRLWGVVDADGIFYPVWWDPKHKVYPMDHE
jgi:hypothetical protein